MTAPGMALSAQAVFLLLGILAVVTLSLVILLLVRLTGARRRSPLREDVTRILDAFPSMIGYWDATLRNQFANRAYANWLGNDLPPPQGTHLREFDGDALFDAVRPHLEAVLAGRTVAFEQTIPGRGAAVAGHFLVNFVPDIVKGRVLGFYALKHDITRINDNHRRLATLLRENDNLLSTLHRHAIVSVADAGGRITDANPAFCTISGYTRTELLGCDHRVISSGTHSREFWRSMWRTLAKGKPWRGEICNRAKDGSIYWVDSIVAPFLDDSGQIAKYISIRHDITAHKNAQEQLHDAIELAKNANDAKSEFLANMSHEIRTPLNAIIGLGHVLEQTPLSDTQRQFLTRIQLAGRALRAVVDNVLDLSKIEAGEMQLERAPVKLAELASELEQMLSTQAAVKGVELHVHAASELPPTVLGDPSRVRQILTNLVTNAIKFTAAGSVTLALSLAETCGDQVRVRCVVTDTGIGIDADLLARLFMPFMQADASTTRRFGGAGLGLSIVRRFVDLMGGQMGVSSTRGVGSTFWVELPFQSIDASQHPARSGADVQSSKPLSGTRLLAVDDSDIDLEVVRHLLEQQGATVATCSDGAGALRYVAEHAQELDLILLDVQMPLLDGIEVTQRIRSDPRLSWLPILALTAGALISERQRCLEVGMSDFVSKPFDPPALIATVRNLLDSASGMNSLAVQSCGDDAMAAWLQLSSLDPGMLQQVYGRDVGLFTTLLTRLLRDYADFGQSLSVLPQDHKAREAFRKRVHKLKGGASMLGAVPLMQCAQALETAMRENAEPVQLLQRLTALNTAFRTLRAQAEPLMERHATLDQALFHRDVPVQIVVPSQSQYQQRLGQDIAHLCELLEQSDLAALDSFDRLTQSWRDLQRGELDGAREVIEDLHFSLAGERLRAMVTNQLERSQPVETR